MWVRHQQGALSLGHAQGVPFILLVPFPKWKGHPCRCPLGSSTSSSQGSLPALRLMRVGLGLPSTHCPPFCYSTHLLLASHPLSYVLGPSQAQWSQCYVQGRHVALAQPPVISHPPGTSDGARDD